MYFKVKTLLVIIFTFNIDLCCKAPIARMKTSKFAVKLNK